MLSTKFPAFGDEQELKVTNWGYTDDDEDVVQTMFIPCITA